MKAVNYTPELTAQIVDQYQSGVSVADIASSIEKSVRSVRSKLVREGVYVAAPKSQLVNQTSQRRKNCSMTLRQFIPLMSTA